MGRVEFVLGFSRGFTGYLLLLYLGATSIIFCLPIPGFFKIIGAALLFLYFWQIWNLHGRRASKKAVVRIWQDPNGRWGCQTKDGHCALGELKGDSFRSIWLHILRFRFRSRSMSVVVPRDALHFMEYRVLSSRLNQFK